MPELPDIEHYLVALDSRIRGIRLVLLTIQSPFLLRTVEPGVSDVTGLRVVDLKRIGKRIAIELEHEIWLVIHLMVAGRLVWKPGSDKKETRKTLAVFEFDSGNLILTEAGSKKRASLHIVKGREALTELDPHGLEILEADQQAFAARLVMRNHTLKRALTDPLLFSGIGNAYSDEILHHAKLSPIAQTQKLNAAEIGRLYDSVRTVLQEWSARLIEQAGNDFPTKVTAFRPEMAVHGRYGELCRDCGTEIQRIRYAQNELNYCPRCQTGGRVLADRALSRLLKKDWPRTIEELEWSKSKT
jgi:formamidopyrimidine-DNA glycosylase